MVKDTAAEITQDGKVIFENILMSIASIMSGKKYNDKLFREREMTLAKAQRPQGFRTDIVVESKVIVELKSVERITNAHKKKLLTYLKLTGMKLGYLLNFGEDMMKHGITRTVNGLPE